MKAKKQILTLATAATLAGMTSNAGAALVLQYDPNPVTPASDPANNFPINHGTFIGAAGTHSAAPTGPPGHSANHFDDGNSGGNTNGSGISTGAALSTFEDPNGSISFAAWVNLDGTPSGDNMVFGTDGGNPLHLGFRGGDTYFGVWGADDSNVAGHAPGGAWHHFVWVQDTPQGFHDIYEDGLIITHSPGHGALGHGGEILEIGANGGNGGDLLGSLADVRVYSGPLDAAGALAVYNSSVPEPASFAVIAGAIGMLVATRRRR